MLINLFIEPKNLFLVVAISFWKKVQWVSSKIYFYGKLTDWSDFGGVCGVIYQIFTVAHGFGYEPCYPDSKTNMLT